MNDLISRKAAFEALCNATFGCADIDVCKKGDRYCAEGAKLDEVPSAQPTLYGYDIEHLELIANVLRKENLPPESIAEVLTDISRIIAMVRDEFEETLRKAAVERCKI